MFKNGAEKKAMSPPLINIPTATKTLMVILLITHLLRDILLSQETGDLWTEALWLVPAQWVKNPLSITSIGLVGHMFLHGSWMHLLINTTMLAALGSGVERLLGGKKMLFFFFLSGVFAALTYIAFNASSYDPMVGASGGVSGLFGVLLVLLHKQNRIPSNARFGILPVVALWVLLTIGFGLIGSPDGNAVAWEAHVGGFLAGIVLISVHNQWLRRSR